MKSYSYIVVFIYKLFFFYFISLQAFAQENDGDILSPPQNIVPEILEEEIIDTEAASTNILNEVIIDDLPNNKPAWIGNLSFEDGAATLTELTAVNTLTWVERLTLEYTNLILCGGGRKNKFLLKRLKESLSNNFRGPFDFKMIDELGIDGDFIESQAFAYLAIRSFLKLPISFPDTTRCNKPCTGGVLVKNY